MMAGTDGAPLLVGTGMIYSVRPDQVLQRFPPPDRPELNIYTRGGDHHLAMVSCATVRWETREMQDYVEQMTDGCWRAQQTYASIYTASRALRQAIADTRHRTIPDPDDGAWLCGCYITARWYFESGRWLRIYEQTIRPVTQLAQSYDYGLSNIGPAGRQYGMI